MDTFVAYVLPTQPNKQTVFDMSSVNYNMLTVFQCGFNLIACKINS